MSQNLPTIYISYRRDDKRGETSATGKLFCSLGSRYGQDNVFVDQGSLTIGNYKTQINEWLDRADVLIAVIGNLDIWLGTTQEKRKRSRIKLRNDWVRYELQTAIDRKIPIIPLFVGNVESISINQLPTSLRSISEMQAFKISNRWADSDITKFCNEIEKSIAERDEKSDEGMLLKLLNQILRSGRSRSG